MRKTIFFLAAIMGLLIFAGCNDYETYGDQKEKERKDIKAFIADSAITVIDEKQFEANGYATDLAKNEFVYLKNSGVYMQIVRKGVGEPLRDGEQTNLIVRFIEVCLHTWEVVYNAASAYNEDIMYVTRTADTYDGKFTDGYMFTTYGEAVPSGWLSVFKYINLDWPHSADEQIAKVRLIVPHTQGHQTSKGNVYPYYYEITFKRAIDR